jgi:hypothetical protein
MSTSFNDDYVWVAVRVIEPSGQMPEFRGRLAMNVFDRIISNEMTAGWFALESVRCDQDGRDIPQKEAGKIWGYGEVSFFRVENLARIILLSDGYVRSLPRQV